MSIATRGPARTRRHRAPRVAPVRLARCWPGVVAVIGVAVAEIVADAPVGDVLLYAVVLALGTTLPGMLLYRRLRGRPDTLVGDLALGTATGLIAQLPCWMLAAATGLPWLVWMGPVAVVGAFLAVPKLRSSWRVDRYPAVYPRYLSLVVLVAFALLMVDIAEEHLHAAALPPSSMLWYPDMYFHLSIAGALTHHVLPTLPQVAGVPLSYHWFSHANEAAMGMSSGIGLPVILVRLWGAPIAALLLGLLVTLARAVTRSDGAAAPAALMVALSPSIKLTPWLYVPPTNSANMPDSPSTAYGAVFTLLLLVPVVDLLRGRRLGTGWVVVAAAALMCPGAKVSTLPLVICGVALVALVSLVSLVQRRLSRPVLALLAVLIAAQLVMVPLTSGSGSGVRLRPFAVVRSISLWANVTGTRSVFPHGAFPAGFGGVVPVLLLVVIAAAFVLKFAWLLPALALRRDHNDLATGRDPVPWLLGGCVIAALVAMNVIDQDGGSELYFVTAAVPMAIVLAVWGLQRCWSAARADWPVDVVLRSTLIGPAVTAAVLALFWLALRWVPLGGQLAAGLAAFALLSAVSILVARAVRRADRRLRGAGRRSVSAALLLAVSCGLVVASFAPWARELLRPEFDPVPPGSRVYASESAAADYVRRHAAPDDLVATNVHCLQKVTRPSCNTSAFWVSGFTERQVLVEGWAYSPDAHAHDGVDGMSSRQQPFADPELLAFNDGVFTHPTQAGVDRMYALGVRWLLADQLAGPVNQVGSLGNYATLVVKQGPVMVYRLRAPAN